MRCKASRSFKNGVYMVVPKPACCVPRNLHAASILLFVFLKHVFMFLFGLQWSR